MTFQAAFKVFTKELRRDKGLYRAYQANIAMAYYGCAYWEGSRDSSAKRHAIGNRAADHFLKLLLTDCLIPDTNGFLVRYEDVAPYIKEAGQPDVQQLKPKMPSFADVTRDVQFMTVDEGNKAFVVYSNIARHFGR